MWKEQHLYGSSRLGIFKPEINIRGTYVLNVVALEQAVRHYELTNHLGNVLATITDKGVITSAQDYYPFGLTLESRSFTEGGSSYRYSFNGKEDDKGLKQQDYGFRIYRPDLGRFLSVDPIGRQFPFLSPYVFAENDVIRSIDLDGLEKKVVNLYLRIDGSIDRGKTQVQISTKEYVQLGSRRLASTQTYYILPSGTKLDGGVIYEQVGFNGRTSAGIYPSAAYNFNEKDPNYGAEMSHRIEDDGGRFAGFGTSLRDKIVDRNDLAPERRVAMNDFYAVVELGTNIIDAGVPFIILKTESRILANADGSIEYHYTQRDGSAAKLIDNRAKRPHYENPGHHELGPGFRGGGAKKTEIIPNNHTELWESAIPDINGPLTQNGVAKNWYSRDANGQIHRFQADHNGNAHWSGSTGGASGLEVPSSIKSQLKK